MESSDNVASPTRQNENLKERKTLLQWIQGHLSFFIFLLISATLWLMVKLSKEYSTQTAFAIRYLDIPVEKCISTPEQTVNLSFVTNGFRTLRHNLIRPQNRIVDIRLSAVPYHAVSETSFSISSQYVAAQIADLLNINPSDIVMNDAVIYFGMENLHSKVVQVKVPVNIKTQRQYKVYGQPTLTPPSVTIFGPEKIIDTMTAVYTSPITKTSANAPINETLPLDFGNGQVRSNITEAVVNIDIEKYTEADFKVPVTPPDNIPMRFFPETIDVKCLVAIKDYPNIKPESFKIEVLRSNGTDSIQPLLDVSLTKIPQHVKVLNVAPKKVEYLIVR